MSLGSEGAFRGACAFPIIAAGTAVGVGELLSRESRPLDGALSSALRGVGTQLGELIRRERAERGLRTTEQRFRMLLDSVEDYAIFALDPDGMISSWNKGAERIFHYAAPEVIGRHFSLLYPREDRESGQPEVDLRRAIAEDRNDLDGRRLRKDGARLLASISITAQKSEDGQLCGFANVMRLVSALRSANADL